MMTLRRLPVSRAAICISALLISACAPDEPPAPTSVQPAAAPAPGSVRDMGTVLAESTPGDWRPLDPENTLYMDLAQGRVIIEMSPAYAPRHVANIKALVREGYFDGLAIMRTQDNYVVQWGDAEGTRELKAATRFLPA